MDYLEIIKKMEQVPEPKTWQRQRPASRIRTIHVMSLSCAGSMSRPQRKSWVAGLDSVRQRNGSGRLCEVERESLAAKKQFTCSMREANKHEAIHRLWLER